MCILLDSINVGQHEQEQRVMAGTHFFGQIRAGRPSASVTHWSLLDDMTQNFLRSEMHSIHTLIIISKLTDSGH